jgi:Na+-driven multidrug efflux pump
MSYGFQGIFRLCSSALNAMGRPLYSTLLHILRLFVLYVPLALLLNRLTGMEGIFYALLAANLVSGSLALLITLRLASRK